MPTVQKIEQLKRILMVLGAITIVMIFATSGTKYTELPILFIMLPIWFAMFYRTQAIRSFSLYLQTNFPDYYKVQARNANRRSGFGVGAVWLISPYAGDFSGKKVRLEIVEMLKDPGYISSLEALQGFNKTSIQILGTEMVVFIVSSFLK